MRRVGPVAAVVAGCTAVVAAAALVVRAPAHDTAVLVGSAAGVSLLASSLGGLALRGVRHRSMRVQASAIAGVALAATAAGVLVAAHNMFISSHDLGALLLVVAASAPVAFGAALQIGRHLDAGARHVRAIADRVGDGLAVDVPRPPDHGTPEFDDLAAQVADLPRRLAELREKAERAEASRRELVAWVSHDLRAPLATIRAMAEALDDQVVTDAPTVARYHHQILRDAERLSTLVDDLFELSRIQSGTPLAGGETGPLDEVVDDALAGARAQAEIAGVTLVDDVDGLPAFEVARVEITRVVHNLLDNAIRHTPRGGTVVVRSVVDGSGVLLHVEDECGGIPEPDLSRVFDVAFRGDAARTRDAGGGGLGLAIAKGLVEACDGTIEVDNDREGCRFTVRLPGPS